MALFLCIYTFIKCEKEGAGALFFVGGREGGGGGRYKGFVSRQAVVG